jgi:putative MATE family efflux protein
VAATVRDPQGSSPLLTAPILGVLVRLSIPNIVAMSATAVVAIAETAYVGLLGTEALAALALAFPMVILQQMLAGGSIGGAVSSAVARALGARDEIRARDLALHAVAIGLIASLVFGVVFLELGGEIYRLLGAAGGAQRQALDYSNVLFAGLIAIWLTHMLSAVLRGAGNMAIPSAALFMVAGLQVVLGGSLGLGLGPVPRLGMAGVALGQVLAFAIGATFLVLYMLSGRSRIRLTVRGVRLRGALFADIIKVGALATISPLQSILSILILTWLIARFGTEALAGYGIGTRLEFLIIPIAFAIGISSLPMVGMAVGAGDIARARKVAWTAGGISGLLIGVVGLLVMAVPDLWATLFSDDPAVLAAARSYLSWSGAGFGFLALALCLYFSAQGAGKVLGPVLASTVRLIVIVAVGWALTEASAPMWTIFALSAGSFVIYGLSTALAVHLSQWGPARPATAAA